MRASLKQIIHRSLILCAVLLLGGCALNPINYLRAPDLPDKSITVSGDRTTTERRFHLERARKSFSKGYYGIAIGHLEKELAERPDSIAALNGLGASYDKLARYDVAQRYYFRALEKDPGSSLTLGNLGLSYLLQKRNREAAALLELALRHDPENRLASANLQLASQRQAKESKNRTDALVLLDTLAEPEDPPPPGTGRPGLEVSNGNGVQGMAARWRAHLQRSYLAEAAEKKVRISNAEHFEYQQSVIYFTPGHREAAESLQATLPISSIAVRPADTLGEAIDLRLVLGRDIVPYDTANTRT